MLTLQKKKISCEEAITLINNAGGIAVLAHPYLLELENDELLNLVKFLKSIGLNGIEIFYPEHTKEQIKFYCELAEKFDLIKTGGTDFHGENKPQINLGNGKGDFSVDFELYEKILKRSDKNNRKEKMSDKTDRRGKVRTAKDGWHDENISGLEKNIGYKFKNKELLNEALSHTSFVYEQKKNINSNERFEFLGDAVLNLVVAHILMDEYPTVSEGVLTQIRTGLVKESVLAKVAKKINLGAYIHLGKGERLSKGWKKPSILEDAFESTVAAIYLDAGIDQVFEFVKMHFSGLIKKGDVLLTDDHKTRLQELTQEIFKNPPVYKLINTEGPKHKKKFTVKVSIEIFSATGSGDSKKKAEQEAAFNILKILKKSDVKK